MAFKYIKRHIEQKIYLDVKSQEDIEYKCCKDIQILFEMIDNKWILMNGIFVSLLPGQFSEYIIQSENWDNINESI